MLPSPVIVVDWLLAPLKKMPKVDPKPPELWVIRTELTVNKGEVVITDVFAPVMASELLFPLPQITLPRDEVVPVAVPVNHKCLVTGSIVRIRAACTGTEVVNIPRKIRERKFLYRTY